MREMLRPARLGTRARGRVGKLVTAVSSFSSPRLVTELVDGRRIDRTCLRGTCTRSPSNRAQALEPARRRSAREFVRGIAQHSAPAGPRARWPARRAATTAANAGRRLALHGLARARDRAAAPASSRRDSRSSRSACSRRPRSRCARAGRAPFERATVAFKAAVHKLGVDLVDDHVGAALAQHVGERARARAASRRRRSGSTACTARPPWCAAERVASASGCTQEAVALADTARAPAARRTAGLLGVAAPGGHRDHDLVAVVEQHLRQVEQRVLGARRSPPPASSSWRTPRRRRGVLADRRAQRAQPGDLGVAAAAPPSMRALRSRHARAPAAPRPARRPRARSRPRPAP